MPDTICLVIVGVCNACSDRIVFITQLHGVVIEARIACYQDRSPPQGLPRLAWTSDWFLRAVYLSHLISVSLFTRSPFACHCSCCPPFSFQISTHICVNLCFLLGGKKKEKAFSRLRRVEVKPKWNGKLFR